MQNTIRVLQGEEGPQRPTGYSQILRSYHTRRNPSSQAWTWASTPLSQAQRLDFPGGFPCAGQLSQPVSGVRTLHTCWACRLGEDCASSLMSLSSLARTYKQAIVICRPTTSQPCFNQSSQSLWRARDLMGWANWASLQAAFQDFKPWPSLATCSLDGARTRAHLQSRTTNQRRHRLGVLAPPFRGHEHGMQVVGGCTWAAVQAVPSRLSCPPPLRSCTTCNAH